jgi:hypothetical protein
MSDVDFQYACSKSNEGHTPEITNAGSVKMAPAATDSPIEPAGSRDVLLENRAFERAQDHHADDGGGIRRRDGLSRAQSEVRVRGTQNQAHEQARDQRTERELLHGHGLGDERLVGRAAAGGLITHRFILPGKVCEL